MGQALRLFPEAGASGAVGIARLAAAAAPLAAPNTVVYAALEARSLLSRCNSTRVPFDWTLNPYRGCEFGCVYCYARYTHGYMELRDPLDFERRIFVKRETAALLRHDLARVAPGESIAVGTATDPYQPAERRFRLMPELWRVFATRRDLDLGLVTKSTLVERDIAVLREVAAGNRFGIRLTITTADAMLARALEPRAPRPDLRLRTVRRLRAAGLEVGVMCAPVLPGITDSAASLDRLAAAAVAAGASFFSANPLFVPPDTQARLFPFIREHYPRLWVKYKRAFAHHVNAPAEYAVELKERVRALRAKYGLASGMPSVAAPTPTQAALF